MLAYGNDFGGVLVVVALVIFVPSWLGWMHDRRNPPKHYCNGQCDPRCTQGRR
jgi:hypothetical protein